MFLNFVNRLIPLRSSRQRILAAALVVAAVAVACGTDSGSATGGSAADARGPGRSAGPVVKASNASPSFTVETFHHGTYDLDSTVGRPVLINFWFPSCPPCRAELPDLQAAYEEFGDEIDFLGVQQTSVDTVEEGIEFLGELGITYPNFADETETSSSALQIGYRVFSFPTTIFLNRDHSINRTWNGLITESNLREQIEAVINS
ncbi:MAG: TlpA disulfide reductase family protein [Chloroflexi bacterium]|nr:TlpA disulfide reductase family protein [Chloroflexota bacterium]